MIQTLAPGQPTSSTQGTGLTDDQLNQLRQYSQALRGPNTQQPVHSWTQGLSNVVAQALAAYGEKKAENKLNTRQGQAEEEYRAIDRGTPQPAYGAPQPQPQSAAPPNTNWGSAAPAPYTGGPTGPPNLAMTETDPSNMSTG